jgi:hypothetical protein
MPVSSTWTPRKPHRRQRQRLCRTRVLKRITDGATPEELATEVHDALTGEDPRAVTTAVDTDVGTAWIRGLVGVFVAAGATLVNFVTVGDAAVCVRCRDAEAGNPYELAAAPWCPQHPHCRCVIEPVSSLPRLDVARYLITG